ncbi:MAG TPA: VanZ family protein [Usitatibacteraceae bacterium]
MSTPTKTVVSNFTQRLMKFEPWRAGRGALIVYVLVIVYASLSPFIGWHAPESFTLFSWPRYITTFDVALNVLAYAPLGALIAAIWRRHMGRSGQSALAAWAWAVAVAAGSALSGALELLQSMLPGRVSSPLDWLANTGGTVLGATLVTIAPGRAVLAKIEYWRYRLFAAGTHTEWGLLLLALWWFAQLNPAIPFFEAGNVINQPPPGDKLPSYDPLYLLPQAAGIAFNVCGFALMVSLVLASARRLWLIVALVLVLGFAAKVSMAALMLRAPQLIAWMGPGTVIGLVSGLILSTLFFSWAYRWRTLAATLFVFAGGVMAKMSSVYGAFGETLRLFDWPYGHLVNFASVTSWIHEVWPLAAFIFLALVFVKERLGD